jgi:retron-type reverse transcriptase
VADRIAQTVVKLHLEPKVEPIFHPDSYGYRPGKSALDAVAACRQRCWRADWVIDLDIRAFFDTVPWDLVLKAVAHHTDQTWILLDVERWLKAPLQQPDGTLVRRDRGTPQGSAITPPTQWITSASRSRSVTGDWNGRGVSPRISDITGSTFMSCLVIALGLVSTPSV